MRIIRYLLSISGSFVLLAHIAIAQDSQHSAQSHSAQVSICVTDKSGHAVTDLRQEDFLLFEDGKPQKITNLSREDEPISFGLIVDETASMTKQSAFVLEASKGIINSMQPGDEAFLVSIRDSQTTVLAGWTSDKKQLLAPIPTMKAKGKGPVIDSLYVSGEYLMRHNPNGTLPSRRRALVIITDGIEFDSKHNQNQLLKYLGQEHIQVLAVGLYGPIPADSVFSEELNERGHAFLRRVTDDTSGRVFFPQSLTELQRAASEILDYQRSRYTIRYDSLNVSPKSKIRIKLADGPGRDKYLVTVVTQSN